MGASEGEKAAGEEAARLGGDEGERVGREIAGDEGARIGREIGADAARTAGRRHGRKVGKLAGKTIQTFRHKRSSTIVCRS